MQRPADLGLRRYHGMYSGWEGMFRLWERIQRVARSDFSIFIYGETGVGKELVAQAIKEESDRSDAPYHAVNCAALPPTLLESDLFGHKRGAFTGAIADHPGLLRVCHKGTLFLDEVSEIPLEVQAKLLRVLQEKTVIPLGGTKPVAVDARILSASNRRIDEEVAAGRFRADLRYRLQVIPLWVPALRQRPGDIEALFWHFSADEEVCSLRRIEAITPRAMRVLRRHSWPGNVRELRSAVRFAAVAGDGEVLDLEDLPDEITEGDGQAAARSPERERIQAALRRHGGRVEAAANDLGISRQTLWRKRTMLGI